MVFASILTIPNAYTTINPYGCLFGFLDGCTYNLSNPPVYLDLGGALAAFGLIFAVYQLRKPKWDVVLRIRNGVQRNLFWIFGGVGLFLILVRTLITQLPLGYLAYPFNIGVFYEILAYLFFIASPLSESNGGTLFSGRKIR